MTDEQIVKALECCDQEDKCHECPYDLKCYDDKYKSIIAKDALELINHQKAEIEQKDVVIKGLEKALENVTIEADRLLKECESKEKAYTDEYILRKELKAEIERLQSINEILESAFVAECDLSACPRKKEIRDEAIEDALNRAKKRIGDSHFQNYGLAIMEIMEVEKETIDKIMREAEECG